MTSIESQVNQPYKYGWVTDIDAETVPPGLNEDVIRLISEKKKEPEFMLEWRLKAFRRWCHLPEPHRRILDDLHAGAVRDGTGPLPSGFTVASSAGQGNSTK